MRKSQPKSASNFLSQAEVQKIALMLREGKAKEAEVKARKYIKKNPNAYMLYDLMGGAQFAQNNFAGVIKTFEKAIQLQPNNPDWVYNLGLAHMNLNKLEAGLEYFKKAVALNPDLHDGYNNMGVIYFGLRRVDEAIECYEKAISINPKSVSALRNYGSTLRDLGRYEDSFNVLSKIPLIAPRYPVGHFSLGALHADMGKLDKAHASFEMALKLEPNLYQAHYELGKIYRLNGETEKAIAAFEKVDNLIARVQVLEMLHELRRKDELFERLSAINENEPKNLRASAFSAYVAQQYDIENTNAFCKAPLDYVHVTNVSDVISEKPDFLKTLMTAADDLTTVWEHNTTKGGTQTHGNLFDPALENEAFSELEDVVRDALVTYQRNFESSSDLLISGFPKNFSLNGWRVKLMRAGYQKPHIHSAGWVSGVLYLKVPEQMKGNEGSIAFSLHGYDYRKEKENIPGREHLPSEGELVLFPSSLFHWTIPFESDEERQCIAFDVVPD